MKRGEFDEDLGIAPRIKSSIYEPGNDDGEPEQDIKRCVLCLEPESECQCAAIDAQELEELHREYGEEPFDIFGAFRPEKAPEPIFKEYSHLVSI